MLHRRSHAAWFGAALLACHAADEEVGPRSGEAPICDVVFSPRPPAESHNVRVARLIGEAERTLDIAMYSFKDAEIRAALAAATERGVEVRFLFEKAGEDRKLAGAALQDSPSGRLEQSGVDVRWVNKIMHHKFMIVDGPRDDLAAADRAHLVTGSGNWSPGAATIYDENTLFLRGERELVLRMQQEFEHLWTHSRDFVGDPALTSRPSTLALTDAMIADEPGAHVYFTSANFDLRGGDTFVASGREVVSEALVAAIAGASESIDLASNHLRLRGVAEALIARAGELQIRVYLDGQEYIAASTHAAQVAALAECFAQAGADPARRRACDDRGFLFGYQVGAAGIAVRYKFYAYRWHASYAEQMHHKYMVIDGDELWTGSYNLSENAEHNTFENMLVFRGPAYAELVARFADNFAAIWDTGRDDERLTTLHRDIADGRPVPLVFPAMALEHAEIRELKNKIRAACPAVDSPPYREHPEAHRTCE
ncbi:Phosphatidylserine/phosphatidylglycerophosphate/cardiolipin synthase [Nannocystis exedens]|uniref:phospholipase D n=1 Tax=Nannocystis exedens TaxID=54 RepID=A0A1I1VY28_9BACT|nr:phospholipase D-like domain-containing protein [Nannocystis exedens]PCC72946.1 cardiolipin synthetase [Nannocystis exedens]SFD87755.1 Phosphatidylserine/phosphatidylglycerophosphate/cardiolipin synthase [Nannocystis exedens]